MKIFQSRKCKICHDRASQRFCLRKGKEICWKCCNKMRFDRKCPQECKYSLKSEDGIIISRTNADSLAEYRDLVRRLMDLWIRMPEPGLSGEIPENLATSKDGRDRLINYFNISGISNIYDVKYLKYKLGLKELELQREPNNYEDCGNDYLSFLIAGEYLKAVRLRTGYAVISGKAEYLEDFIKQQRDDSVIKKMKDFKIISSALSEDKRQGLVYYDINGKYDLSLRLIKEEEGWQVASHYNGKMELINGENESIKQVAILLAKNERGQSEELLKKYLSIYPDSADLHYLKGMLENIRGRKKNAKSSFLRAVRLDPDFIDAIYNYALLLQLDNEIEKAAGYYEQILAKEPEDIKSLNNLAAICIDRGELSTAENYLQRCSDLDADFEPCKANWERLKELMSN
jgi:tetratricopeptide (TPR) repeat protein